MTLCIKWKLLNWARDGSLADGCPGMDGVRRALTRGFLPGSLVIRTRPWLPEVLNQAKMAFRLRHIAVE